MQEDESEMIFPPKIKILWRKTHMKKVRALVLAVMMLAAMGTMAFAADIMPGTTIKIPVAPTTDTTVGANVLIAAADGISADFNVAVSAVTGAPDKVEVTAKNYSIVNVKWDSGKEFVESLKINDETGNVELKLKQDYTAAIKTTNPKKLAGSFTLRQKGASNKAITYSLTPASNLFVGYRTETLPVPAAVGDDAPIATVEKKIYTTPDIAYSNLTFKTINGDDVNVRVYAKEKYFVASNANADNKILIANADSDADISFLNFPAKPTFNSNATIYFYSVDEEAFIYENKDGKLVKSAAKWDEDEGCWLLKTRTLGSYVISDKALVSAAATETPDNPDTGANDVVGLATALAAVALVSAAAVSLKK